MATELTLSCDSDKTDNGPTLIHSTGVEHYKIPPELIRILQEGLTNDLLADNEEGVLCQTNPQRVLDVLQQNGFNVQNKTDDDGKTVWTLAKNGGSNGGDSGKAEEKNNDNEADAEGEGQGGDDEGENKEEEEGEGEEKEEEE